MSVRPYYKRDISIMKRLSKTNKAYIAGIIDGEGCVRVCRKTTKNGGSYQAFVCVTNSNEALLYWLKEVTEIGCVYKYKKSAKKNWKLVHRFQVVSQNACDLLRSILPYLKIKKEVADVVLSMPINKRGHRNLTPIQETLFMRTKVLNTRGLILAN